MLRPTSKGVLLFSLLVAVVIYFQVGKEMILPVGLLTMQSLTNTPVYFVHFNRTCDAVRDSLSIVRFFVYVWSFPHTGGGFQILYRADDSLRITLDSFGLHPTLRSPLAPPDSPFSLSRMLLRQVRDSAASRAEFNPVS